MSTLTEEVKLKQFSINHTASRTILCVCFNVPSAFFLLWCQGGLKKKDVI